jgi:hypothetical protein
MSEEIERALWNVLRPTGEPVEVAVSVRPGHINVESDDGRIEASISPLDDGVDARIGYVQLFVKGSRVALVQAHPPYPISRWTVLWEGNLA